MASLARWLHIYLSLFGLASVLFFSVTGLTLNHPSWFFADKETRTEAKGHVDPAWLRGSSSSDSAEGVKRLEVVEHLRKAHGVRGAMTEFLVDERECTITFKGPGYAADAILDRESGDYTLNQSAFGAVAVWNDLHKGRDTGPIWSAVIDVSAVLLAIISLTGFILLFYLKLRRVRGLIVTVLGGVVLAGLYAWFVP